MFYIFLTSFITWLWRHQCKDFWDLHFRKHGPNWTPWRSSVTVRSILMKIRYLEIVPAFRKLPEICSSFTGTYFKMFQKHQLNEFNGGPQIRKYATCLRLWSFFIFVIGRNCVIEQFSIYLIKGGGGGSALIFVGTQFWDMSWPWWPEHVPTTWG